MKFFAFVALFAITGGNSSARSSELPSVTRIKAIVANTVQRIKKRVDSDIINNEINTGKPVQFGCDSLNVEVAKKQNLIDMFFLTAPYEGALNSLEAANDQLQLILNSSLPQVNSCDLPTLNNLISDISSNLDKTPKHKTDSCLKSKISSISTFTTSISNKVTRAADGIWQELNSKINPILDPAIDQLGTAKSAVMSLNNVNIKDKGLQGLLEISVAVGNIVSANTQLAQIVDDSVATFERNIGRIIKAFKPQIQTIKSQLASCF